MRSPIEIGTKPLLPPRASSGRRPAANVGWAALLAAAVALPCLLIEPASADLAAQTFRADLWDANGWVLWNDAWYGGHLVPGYSLIYPPLGALLGPRLVGAIAAVGAASAFAALIDRRAASRAAVLASLWFALGAGALLYTGRITFMVGLAFGLAALLSLGRPAWAALLAAAAALSSPVVGLFTALAGAALLLGGRRREGLWLALGAGAATLALVLAFPVGGTQPFFFWSFWWVAAACAIAFAVTPPEWRALRIGIALYALLVVALFVIPTPVGSNAPRLGALMAGPIAALVLADRRPRLLALMALPLLYWQLAAPIGDVVRGAGDPSTERAFYEPLLAQLDRRSAGAPMRVEIPPTRERWESVFVAESHPLARGWLRQLESTDIDGFTDGELTAASYREWLTAHGVSYVALADAGLDYLAEDEAALLRDGAPSFLREVWADDDWTLWEVLPPGDGRFTPGAALADGGARISELGPDGYSVEVPGEGEYLLRMRYARYLKTDSNACLESARGGSTRLRVPDPAVYTAGLGGAQTIRVDARLSLGSLLGHPSACAE